MKKSQFPRGLDTIGIIVLFTIIQLISIVLHFEKITFFGKYFDYFNYLSLYIFQTSTIALFLIISIVIAHILEAIYSLYLMNKLGFSNLAKIYWFIVIVVIGYPYTSKIIQLNNLLKDKKNN